MADFQDESRSSDRTGKENGSAVVVVSGLPRSGTSLMMQMLEAGGVPILTDGERACDADNPKGYYEYEPVKALQNGDSDWLDKAEGKAVKVISFLLRHLPQKHRYRVVFMNRNLDEVLASQEKMPVTRGQQKHTGYAEMKRLYEHQFKAVIA